MSNPNLISPEVERWIDRHAPSGSTVEVSVIVPAYNEQWRLPPTLIDMIDFFDSEGTFYEIIVVDDGSADATSAVVAKFEKIRHQVILIRLPTNRGKGFAVRTGVQNAHGGIVIFADADGSTPIVEFKRLRAALKHGADIAIGSRAVSSADTVVTTRWYRKYLGRMFNFVVNVCLLPEIADTQCGFKMFTAEAARFLFGRQRSDGYSFDVEILYMARQVGLTVKEVAVNWTNVPGSKVSLALDAARMLRDTFLFRFRHRNLTPQMFSEFRRQFLTVAPPTTPPRCG